MTRLRAALAVGLAAQLACMPEIQERCRLVTSPSPPPALPHGFVELDALLLRRATDMTVASRRLNSSMVILFHKGFAEELLPVLCGRLEQARELALAGRTAQAGRKYQALLVSSQVLAFAVAIQSMAQYADARREAGGHITNTLQKFSSEAAPILEAALSEDPRTIEQALNAHPEVFAGWARLLEGWQARVDDAAHKAEVAMVVLDIALLVVATYRAAGAAAEMAAGRPPMPPLPGFATSGGAAAAGLSGTVSLEMAEVLRKLIALGALDAGVVVALSQTFGGRVAPSSPFIPGNASMSTSAEGSGRGGNKLKPDPAAQGSHTTIKTDPQTGKVTNYETYQPQSNPGDPKPWESVKRYDGNHPHFDKATGERLQPHVHDPSTPGGVRPPDPAEIPK